MCGGSIITKSWILTAAHCIEAIPRLNGWLVHAGISTNAELHSGNYPWEHKSDISALILHPLWNKQTYQADVALMKMKTPIVQYTDYIQPHCLPFPSDKTPLVTPGSKVTVVGFGFTDENANRSSTHRARTHRASFKLIIYYRVAHYQTFTF